MTSTKTALFVLVSLAMVLAALGPAAADGGDASLVHACLNPAGQVRIVGPSDACRSQETAVHWPAASAGLKVLTGAGSVPFNMPRGGQTSATITFGSAFSQPPVVMITSTSVLRDVVVSVGNKTAADFEIVLALSANSADPNIAGTYTFDWVAVGQ